MTPITVESGAKSTEIESGAKSTEVESGVKSTKVKPKVSKVEINFEELEKMFEAKVKRAEPRRLILMLILLIVPIIMMVSVVFKVQAELTRQETPLQVVDTHSIPFVSGPLPKANIETADKPHKEFNWDMMKPTVTLSKDKLESIGYGLVDDQWFYKIPKEEEKESARKSNCVAISYGTNKNVKNFLTFEEEILIYTKCRLVIFTRSPVDNPLSNFSNIDPENGRVLFVNTSMSTGGKDLADFMEQLDFEGIDIAEIVLDKETIGKVEASLGLVHRFGQLIFKFHRFQGMDKGLSDRVIILIANLMKNGFQPFHTGSSCNAGGDCKFEYSFLNVEKWGALLADPEDKEKLEDDGIM
ncbi:unnamed protein product [Orchesella dallaii]|uniref:Uncharacterized protein n=1 Tax=Orchesella dallaii TaxID=48710 RepID=A0ABP1QHF6_9HEXA